MAALRHVRLPSHYYAHVPKFPSYAYASRVQTALQQELLAWKAARLPPSSPPPPPTLVSFTPTPTYTLGRRQTEPLSDEEVGRLQRPLLLPPRTDGAKNGNNTAGRSKEGGGGEGEETGFFYYQPTITHAPRGGLTTYHGPGQLVLWPVIDLHSPLHAHLSVRDYACVLERTTIATLARLWGLVSFTTENPGVWVRSGSGSGSGEERKIAALGVHLRRHVTGLGVAINYSTPVAGPAETNPWARIVACGLGDRGVTSVLAELGRRRRSGGVDRDVASDEEEAVNELAETWWSEFQSRLKFHDVVAAAAALREYDAVSPLAKLLHDVGDNDALVEARNVS
ncbi:hypothetical protein F5Y17DRAFT_414128 [Xylariaceae sp. FL0594]|nr:hypothetical protein F5Y17DRAFT_414128 [Xylariaceae sp. FL0594]